MQNLIWGVTLLFGAILTASPAPAADEPAAGEKWTSLFDGETLSGWTMLALGKGESNWDVKDGALVGSGAQSMLFSPKGDYKNFRFRAEIKINDGGNSGMYIRTPKEATFTKGHEIQINSSHKDPVRDRVGLLARPGLQATRPARHLVHPGNRGGRPELPRQDGRCHQGHGQ